MQSPFFSVVIPTFNRASTILDTLHSISEQRFRDFEVIVVDDGSGDATCDIVRSSGITNVIEQANSGPGVARNTGVAAAIGKYIAFLDSDDVWFPWTLATYAEVIQQHNSPAFITGKPQLFEDLVDIADCKATQIKAESFADYYSSGDEWRWFGVSSFVIRRDVFIQAGGFADGRINGEDADLAMKLGTASGFVHITSPPQFGYRVHGGNVTNDTSKSRAGLELLITNEAQGRYPGGGERSAERAKIIARHVRPFTVSAANSGDAVTALRFYFSVIGESVANFRWRFLLGVPVLAVSGLVSRCFRRGVSS